MLFEYMFICTSSYNHIFIIFSLSVCQAYRFRLDSGSACSGSTTLQPHSHHWPSFGWNLVSLGTLTESIAASSNDLLLLRGCLKSPANAKFTERGTGFIQLSGS